MPRGKVGPALVDVLSTAFLGGLIVGLMANLSLARGIGYALAAAVIVCATYTFAAAKEAEARRGSRRAPGPMPELDAIGDTTCAGRIRRPLSRRRIP
jgi:sugar/nucleoside kinase (ribokinase family)